jgi:hypothetical protein
VARLLPQDRKKAEEPGPEQAEVVARCSEQKVNRVALGAGEEVVAEMTVCLSRVECFGTVGRSG